MPLQQLVNQFRSLDLESMRPPGFLARMHRQQEEKVAKVHSGSGWKKIDYCPSCDSTDRSPEFGAFEIQIVRCQSCDLRYCSSQPRNLEDVYFGDTYVSHAKENYLSNVDYRTERFSPERIHLIQSYFPFRAGQSILDIGCGTGWFLEYARTAGYQVFGHEYADHLAQWTEANRKFRVYRGDLTKIQEQFDIITLFDVLEHVPSPKELFANVKRLLRPEGIAVVFTPNFDSLGISLMQRQSNLIMPCDHLTYFTLKSSGFLARKFGFEILLNVTKGLDIGDLKGLYDLEGIECPTSFWQQASDLLQPLLDEKGLGNHLRLIVKNN